MVRVVQIVPQRVVAQPRRVEVVAAVLPALQPSPVSLGQPSAGSTLQALQACLVYGMRRQPRQKR